MRSSNWTALGFFLISMAVVTNVLLVGLAISICYRPFWSSRKTELTVKTVPLAMSIVPLVFAITGLFIGVFPGLFDKYLGTQMATAVAGATLPMKLKLWHGVNVESLLVLGLSMLTLGVGFLVAVKIKPVIVFLSGLLSATRGIWS